MHHKKIIYVIIFIFLSFAANHSYLFSEEEIIVELPTAQKRLPIYVGTIESENSDFSQDLLDTLRNVLVFDLNYNGSTEVIFFKDKNLGKLLAEKFSEAPDFSSWKKANILYLLKLRMEGKSLLVKISAINGQTVKLIDGISISGDISKDRRTMHALSDTIYQMLFQKQGIACSRILYTKKLKIFGKPGKPIMYTSELFEADYDGANAKQLTSDGSFATTPAIIPEASASESIVWVSYKIGQSKLYFAQGKDGIPKRVTTLRGSQFTPGVSPDGTKIAFSSDVTGNSDIFLQNFHSQAGPLGKPIQIFTAKGAANASPTFAPDGNKIAFVSNKDGSPKIYILSIPKEGEKVSNIKPELISKRCRENSSPSWSPDGQKIAYSGKSQGARQIWIYDFSSNTEYQLTQGKGDKENPSWAKDSLHLLFNASDDKSTELYLINLNQPEAVQITSSLGEKRFPCWLKPWKILTE